MAKTGRPRKMPASDMVKIVDAYYISTPDARAAGKHGVYTKLAEFAKSYDYDLTAYDFSRCQEARDQIDTWLLGTTGGELVPAYVPLDIAKVLSLSTQAAQRMLQKREDYYSRLQEQATKMADALADARRAVAAAENLLAQVEDERDRLSNQCKSMSQAAASDKALIQRLRMYIRTKIDPVQAAEVLGEVNAGDEAALRARVETALELPLPPKGTKVIPIGG